MEITKFDPVLCKTLIDQKKIEEAKAYVRQYFFRYTNKILFFNGIDFKLYNYKDIVNLVPSDLQCKFVTIDDDQRIKKTVFSVRTFLTQTEFMKTEYIPTIDFTRNDMIFSREIAMRYGKTIQHYVNMARSLNNDIVNRQAKRTKSNLKGLELIYTHIREVICSSNLEMYEYTLNFFAATFGGRKLRKALIWQSGERTGKGIILNNVIKRILGDRMHKTSSVESLLKYSNPFEGRTLVNFDELPHSGDYKGVSDVLKSLITEPTFESRAMYSGGYTMPNTFNIIVTSNNDSILLTQSNNSRYVVNDISEKRIGDTDYFDTLKQATDNMDVLKLFYDEMMNRFTTTVDDWNEDLMPSSESRKTKLIEALPKIYKYLKEEFVLKGLDLHRRTNLFLQDYKDETGDKTTPNKIGRYLKDLGIVPKKRSNNDGYDYRISCEDLTTEYEKRGWIDDVVDVVNPDEDKQNIMNDLNYKCKYEDLLEKFNNLQKKVQETSDQTKPQKTETKQKKKKAEPVPVIKNIMKLTKVPIKKPAKDDEEDDEDEEDEEEEKDDEDDEEDEKGDDVDLDDIADKMFDF